MKVRLATRWWAVFTALIAVVAVATWLFWPSRSVDTATHDTATLIIERSSGGGLAGKGDGKNLTIEGSKLTHKDQVTSLSQAETQMIIAKINEAQFFELNNVYRCRGCADQFLYSLHITLDDKTNTVGFDDGFETPATLIELDRYLRGLVQ